MRPKHAHYARAPVVFRDLSVSRDVPHAAGREASWWFSRDASAPPVKAPAKHSKILRAAPATAAAGPTPGKRKRQTTRRKDDGKQVRLLPGSRGSHAENS